MIRICLLLLIYPFVNGCGSSSVKEITADTIQQTAPEVAPLTPGIVQAINASDGSRFQLYVPAGLDTSAPAGVVVFLDPHADGRLPLNYYKHIADSLHLVFAGSDVSGNGVSMQTISAHLDAVKTTLNQRLKLQSGNYYLCGFSGGARAAAALAAQNGASGVVLCSAAPGDAVSESLKVAGVAGTGDMNYLEMRKWFESNQSAGLYLFAGEHTWPPSAALSLALEAILISTGNASETIAAAYSDAAGKRIDSLSANDCDLAAQLFTAVSGCLSKFPAQQKALMNAKRSAITGAPCVKQHSAKRSATEEIEKTLQTEIQQTIFSKDPVWWQENASRLFEAKPGSGEEMMRKRVRGYASLLCYSYTTRAMKSNNPNGTDKLITTYSIVDPENAEWAYLRACLDARLGMPDLAFEALNKSVKLGFKDKVRAESEADLTSLRADQRWVSFITSISL
ncbi:MAG: TPR end-of-group domain-containing protein [Bacteroidota bacterium]